MSATKLHHVTTKVGRLAFADEGNGTPVLFWPSLFSDGETWRVIRIDGLGFGQSDAPQGDVQADIYA